MSRQYFLDQRVPSEVWIAGKGPSVDRYDWSQAGHCRIAINEAVFVIPEPWAVFAIDYNVLEKLNGIKIPVIMKEKQSSYRFPKEWLWTYDQAEGHVASIDTLVMLLGPMGVKRIHFVGCDSFDGEAGYAPSIIKIGGEGSNTDQYKAINKSLQNTLLKYKIAPVWEHRKC